MDIPPPPPVIQDGDLSLAPRRLSSKSSFTRLLSLPNLNLNRLFSASFHSQLLNNNNNTPDLCDDAPINLDNSALIDQDFDHDRFEWAILYENQRGQVLSYLCNIPAFSISYRITIFSVPYYSSLSLLPSDPSPFTLPNTSLKREDQPPITLANYPLPDGDWHWVSRCWMVDMRADSAEVQHDGFEYNWMFRKHNWSPRVGPWNAHGWVRRRRWIRLMVRPAKQKKVEYDGFNTPNSRRPQSFTPSSVLTSGTDITDHWIQVDPANVWLGEPDGDLQRCLSVMKLFGRDGRKLELWKLWLGCYDPDQFLPGGTNAKGKQPEGEIEKPFPSAIFPVDVLSPDSVPIAAREHVIAVLRHHVNLFENTFHMYSPSLLQGTASTSTVHIS